MLFPLDLGELSVFYALVSIILLVASELIPSYHRRINIPVSRKRLRLAAIVFSVLFLVTIGMRIYSIILTI